MVLEDSSAQGDNNIGILEYQIKVVDSLHVTQFGHQFGHCFLKKEEEEKKIG